MPAPASAEGKRGPAVAMADNGSSGIFWRTFLLIALLISTSLGLWFQSFRVLEREPRAEQLAETLVSVVNVTRAALIHSDPGKRRALLVDLARNEGVRIYPREDNDQVAPLPQSNSLRLLANAVRARLGANTSISVIVNGQEGIWVDFTIDSDEYWVAFESDRVENVMPLNWASWGIVALVLSLFGAIIISRLINAPLKRLTQAAVALARGRRPAPLPERGPTEIRVANASFNQMVKELERIEADRALLLAGISHDLRTPLTRLRLEIEMSPANDETRQAMASDIDQMDAIIGQFLDYARPVGTDGQFRLFEFGEWLKEHYAHYPETPEIVVSLTVRSEAWVRADPVELQRLIDNLIENARRYGRDPQDNRAYVHIELQSTAREVILDIRDTGPGVPEDQLENLKRPFTRLDTARSQANGAGLGLAIINRIADRHGARLTLDSRPGAGFGVRIAFPVISDDAPKPSTGHPRHS